MFDQINKCKWKGVGTPTFNEIRVIEIFYTVLPYGMRSNQRLVLESGVWVWTNGSACW